MRRRCRHASPRPCCMSASDLRWFRWGSTHHRVPSRASARTRPTTCDQACSNGRCLHACSPCRRTPCRSRRYRLRSSRLHRQPDCTNALRSRAFRQRPAPRSGMVRRVRSMEPVTGMDGIAPARGRIRRVRERTWRARVRRAWGASYARMAVVPRRRINRRVLRSVAISVGGPRIARRKKCAVALIPAQSSWVIDPPFAPATSRVQDRYVARRHD